MGFFSTTDDYIRRARALALAGAGTRDALLEDPEFLRAAERARTSLVTRLARELPHVDPALLGAVAVVPRERFVRLADLPSAYEDAPLPLDASGRSTISAPHAYLLVFNALELRRGDTFVELGSGSGYGGALAAEIVGPNGRVVTLEIDPALAETTRKNLAHLPNVTSLLADATREDWNLGEEGHVGPTKIACTYGVRELPRAWLARLGEGDRLVAPVGPPYDQRLVCVQLRDGELFESDLGGVRFVLDRSVSRT